LTLSKKRQGEIGIEMAFMEFVQDNNTVMIDVAMKQQFAGEDTLRDVPEPSLGAAYLLETNLIPDAFTKQLRRFLVDSTGG
jgi:hypothetical protein